MCLSVYLGSDVELEPSAGPVGALTFERAKDWVPPPLRTFKHVYALGQRAEGDMGCSCLLAEYLEFDADGPRAYSDGSRDLSPTDPFEDLKALCQAAIAGSLNKWAGLACDDFSGQDIGADAYTYDVRYLDVNDIRSGGMLFSDAQATWPVRGYMVFDPTLREAR